MALERVQGGWRVRLRFGKGQRQRFLMPDMTKAQAEDRAARLERMASKLARASHEDAKTALERCARQVSEKDFASVERAIDTLAAEARKEASGGEKSSYTFRDVAEAWLSGDLRERFPDEVPKKGARSVNVDRGLFAYIYPAIGELDVTKITREDCEAAKRLIPKGLRQSSRGRYAGLIRRIMHLAVVIGLIDHSPVPKGFVPPAGKPRARPFLYPDEDAILMRCPDSTAPLGLRLAYGFMNRNGTRPSETALLTRGDFDLKRGVVNLDENKTDDPRSWALDGDVVRALKRYWGENLDPETPAFPEFVLKQGARRLRRVLKACGLDRQHLRLSTELRGPMTLHGLRGTFVTVALASGRKEYWVMQRTGHTTSTMVARYRRQVEALEMKEEWFQDLEELLYPVGHRVGQVPRRVPGKGLDSESGTFSVRVAQDTNESSSGAETADPEKSTPSQSGAGPAGFPQVGQAQPGETTTTASSRPGRAESSELATKPHPPTVSERGDLAASEPVGPAAPGRGGRAGQTKSKGAEADYTPESSRERSGVPSPASAPADPLAQAIADLALSIRRAAEAGQWDLALRWTNQLELLTARGGKP